MQKRNTITLKEAFTWLACVIASGAYAVLSGVPLLAVLLMFVLAGFLRYRAFDDEKRAYSFLDLSLLYLLGVLTIYVIQRHPELPVYLIPVAAFSMLAALLYRDLELAVLFSVGLAVTAGLIFDDLILAVILLSGGIAGALFVWKARRRSSITAAGFFTGLIQLLAVLSVSYASRPDILARFCGIQLFNGILCAILASFLLWVFEGLFKIVTDVSLLELADFNHPLLKRLVLEAPGTYHHSLMVGNLSEMAAEAVGANPLLARVGAYYHDIGKLSKPEYFSENMDRCGNKHDNLSASMSKLVIMDHVKNGVELARKNRLNEEIVSFITQHHGTSLVYYFYRRALEEKPEKEDVKEEVFRYPGPRPQSRETAIVLLADSVEAACRALEEPTAERIADIVHRIINNKFIDGQLDHCDLTLKDLDRISATFIHILAAFYHSRIEYPEPSPKDASAERKEK
ncbi:MAG: HD family phosphohydrolase [Deltaproteobacteria bacterium]